MKKKTKVILWCISTFLLFGTAGYLFDKMFLAAFFLLLTSISCNPLFLNYLIKIGKNPPKFVKIVIPVILFFIAGLFIPSPSSQMQNLSSSIDPTIEIQQTTTNNVERITQDILQTPTFSERSEIGEMSTELDSNTSVTLVEEKKTVEETKSPETTTEETTIPETAVPTTEIQTTQAETPTEIMVHITNTGSKYHRGGCQYLRKSDITVSLKDAKSRGLSPCSKCHPPQ